MSVPVAPDAHSWGELKAGRVRLACVVLDEEPAGRP